MSEPVFLLGLAMAATTAVLIVRAIAGAIAGRGAPRSDLAEIRERLDDAHNSLADQATHIAELQERLDFAERLLAQARDRTALGPGEHRG